GDVHPGQHDFRIAIGDEFLDLLDHEPHGYRAGGATAIGNDAEGAAMVAAVLHLNEGAGAAIHALDEVPGRLAHAHDVVDLHLVVERRAEDYRLVALGLELIGIADDEIDF